MNILRLTQRTISNNNYNVEVSFESDNIRQTVNSTFSFNLTPQEQENIRWYLEDFLDNSHNPAPIIAASIEKKMTEIGKDLFRYVFQSNDDARDLWAAIRVQLNGIRVEIATEVEEATSIPWELIRDPKTEVPISLRARSFVRTQSQTVQRPYIPSVNNEKIRILLVICRPSKSNDVPFRSVASRLIKALNSESRLAFQLDVLRPPTFERLGEVLRMSKANGVPYHIVHFDGHGAFLDIKNMFAQWEQQSEDQDLNWLNDLIALDTNSFFLRAVYPRILRGGQHGYLLFENPDINVNLRFVDGQEIGKLLVETNVPVLVLNACRSAHAEASSEPTDKNQESDPHSQVRAFGSFAQEVMDAGVAGIVAMRYNVYVVTAAQFVGDLYSMLIQGLTLGESVTFSRKQLADNPIREVLEKPYSLDDWCVPIVYEAAPISLFSKPRQDAFNIKVNEGQTFSGLSSIDPELPPSPDVGFFGQDETILALDRAFDTQPVVLLHAYAGSGKTTTACEFARWYIFTGGVQGVVIFTSFQQYKPLSHLLDQFGQIFQSILLQNGIEWLALKDTERRQVAQQILKLVPVLWIWDNVEMIEGFPTGTHSFWNAVEQQELVKFLKESTNSKAKFLLTSRRDEHNWLGNLPMRVSVPPLRMQDRIQLTKAVAKKYGRSMSDIEAWHPLLRFSRGNPLTITILVGQALRDNLKTYEQIELFVNKLREGEDNFDDEENEGRTKSLGASLGYGFSNTFTELELRLVALLYFFQGSVMVYTVKDMIDSEFDWSVSELSELGIETITSIFDRAAEIGLLTKVNKEIYDIHPAVPWFLKRLFDKYYKDKIDAISKAFMNSLEILGLALYDQYMSGKYYVFFYLRAQEVNLIYAYKLALKKGWWEQVFHIVNIIGKWFSNTGRQVEYVRLYNEVITNFIDLSDDSPLPGREEWWENITFKRAELASDSRNSEEVEHLYGLLEDAYRRNVTSFISKPSELLQVSEKQEINKLASVLLRLAEYQRLLLDIKSLTTAKEALDLFLKSGNDDMVARTGFQIGHIYSEIPDIKNNDEAEHWYKFLQEHFQGRNPQWEAIALHELGQVNYRRFRTLIVEKKPTNEINNVLNNAINYANRALELTPKENLDLIKLIYHLLGNIYDDAGYPEEAIPNYSKAIRIADAMKDYAFSSTLRREVSRSLLKVGRYDDALLYAQAALSDLEFLGNGAVEDIKRAKELIDVIVYFKEKKH